MVRLYALDLRSRQLNHWLDLLPTLPQERQQQIRSCRLAEDQVRLAGAGWLLQLALQQAGVPIPQQQFVRTRFGKPRLADRDVPHFSLSHSGHWAVCAVADHPVGVDVELPRCTSALARRHFHPEEVAAAATADDLCRLWTAKEAFLKALGVGLTIPLDSFLVRLTAEAALLEQTQSPLPYRLHEYPVDGSRICLCTTDDKPELRFIKKTT